jgi:hypothetical protein
MTDLLERAVAVTRGLSPDLQDEIARLMLAIADEDLSLVRLSAETEASFAKSLAQAEEGAFASDEDVGAVWAKHGL